VTRNTLTGGQVLNYKARKRGGISPRSEPFMEQREIVNKKNIHARGGAVEESKQNGTLRESAFALNQVEAEAAFTAGRLGEEN